MVRLRGLLPATYNRMILAELHGITKSDEDCQLTYPLVAQTNIEGVWTLLNDLRGDMIAVHKRGPGRQHYDSIRAFHRSEKS